VEDIILKCGGEMIQYGRWLMMVSGVHKYIHINRFDMQTCLSLKDVKGGADFSTAKTLRIVHTLIQSMDKDLPRKFSM